MKKYIWPSINNSNPLTLRCQIFGCNTDAYPATLYEPGEKHGINGIKSWTATTTSTKVVLTGCSWCKNYKKSFGEETEVWPKWLCDCKICQ